MWYCHDLLTVALLCWCVLHLVYLWKLKLERLNKWGKPFNWGVEDSEFKRTSEGFDFALSTVASHHEWALSAVYLIWFCSVFLPFSFSTGLFQQRKILENIHKSWLVVILIRLERSFPPLFLAVCKWLNLMKY